LVSKGVWEKGPLGRNWDNLGKEDMLRSSKGKNTLANPVEKVTNENKGSGAL